MNVKFPTVPRRVHLFEFTYWTRKGWSSSRECRARVPWLFWYQFGAMRQAQSRLNLVQFSRSFSNFDWFTPFKLTLTKKIGGRGKVKSGVKSRLHYTDHLWRFSSTLDNINIFSSEVPSAVTRGWKLGAKNRAPKTRAARGSRGILPHKILKSRGSKMLFPTFSKSYL